MLEHLNRNLIRYLFCYVGTVYALSFQAIRQTHQTPPVENRETGFASPGCPAFLEIPDIAIGSIKQEFISNPDVSVFQDADDGDSWKWNEIEKTSDNAPIPPETRKKLDEMYQ